MTIIAFPLELRTPTFADTRKLPSEAPLMREAQAGLGWLKPHVEALEAAQQTAMGKLSKRDMRAHYRAALARIPVGDAQ